MVDTSFFQINDIVLNIPPEQITVQRNSFNNFWHTLRTRSSIKNKSGYSSLDITLLCKFTDLTTVEDGQLVNGFDKLKALVSQFRVTPFCYIENQYLRTSILGGAQSPNMALALRQMQIVKSSSPSQGTNVIDVVFTFAWFNYFPYLRDFTFKADMFSQEEVKDPRESSAWKLLYIAEQQRALYGAANPTSSNPTILAFTQFAQFKVKRYEYIKRRAEALTKLKGRVSDTFNTADIDVEVARNRLAKELSALLKGESDDEIYSLSEDIVGSTTTMLDTPETKRDKNLVAKIVAVIDRSLTQDTSIYAFGNAELWQPVVNNKGQVIRIKGDPTLTYPQTKQQTTPERDDVILLKRIRVLNLNQTGLIVTNLSLSFENVLATIPLAGQPYPTFQHIGSNDAVLTLSIMTTSEESLQALTSFYSIVEDQALKYKVIPEGQRNIEVTNDLVNMCGLREFIPNALTTETIPGQPGTYSIQVELIDNPVTSQSREKIEPGQSFTTTEDLRVDISNVMVKNLAIPQELIPTTTGIFDFGGVDISVKEELGPGGTFNSGGSLVGATGGATIETTNFYRYTGPGNNKAPAFSKLCTEYGQNLGALFAKLANLFIKVNKEQLEGPVLEFFALSNKDVHGVEQLQEDLFRIVKSLNKRIVFGLTHNVADTKQARELAKQIIAAEISIDTNVITKIRNDSSLTPEDIQQKEEGFIAGLNRVSDFMNDVMGDWMVFSARFIDNIIQQGLLDLPEFGDLKNKIKNLNIQASGNAYPDFPLDQVINLLRTSDDKNVSKVFDKLDELATSKRLAFKNIGISSLIGPDFYFYNRQNDDVTKIVPGTVIDAARDAVKTIHNDTRLQSETQWYNDEYIKKFIGQSRNESIVNEATNTKRDTSFWNSEDKARQDVQNSIRNYRKSSSVFEIDDLQNETEEGLGCSILEHSQFSGEDYGPIKLGGITDKSDPLNFFAIRRTENQTLVPNVNHYSQIRHRFGTNSIDAISHASVAPVEPLDPNKSPKFDWPTRSGCRRVTREWSDVPVPHPKLKNPDGTPLMRKHNGMDISMNQKEHEKGIGSEGQDILAAADGTIIQYPYSATEQSKGTKSGGEGNGCTIKHSNGFKTKYFHMKWDDFVADLSAKFWQTNGGLDTPFAVEIPVIKGQRIGTIGNTGTSTGAHLHFEVYQNNQSLDPHPIVNNEHMKLQIVPTPNGVNPTNDSMLDKSIEQLENSLRNGQGYTMARAYPTFRFYFIESDAEERKRFQFDDLFSYSSIKEIQLVRSRKIAADLLIVQVTNVSGVLSNKKFGNRQDAQYDAQGNQILEPTVKSGQANKVNTTNENPLASLMLQAGIQVQLRLGYNANPEELETVFNGVITEVQFTENEDLVTLICQSFGIQLVQSIHGEVKSFGGLFTGGGRTARILEELLAFPEVTHFGRWARTVSSDNSFRSTLTTRWNLFPSPADDNIFAPTGRGIWGIFDSTKKYTMYHTTIWDVFQEMVLRHPAYVAQAVPYKGRYEERMTMFFGVPDQYYFARDPTLEEESTSSALKTILEESKAYLDEGDKSLDKTKDTTKTPTNKEVQEVTAGESDLKLARKQWLDNQLQRLAAKNSIIKPFRSYHLLTSTNHIIDNNISNAAYNTFNTVTLQYGDKEASPNEKSDDLEFGDLKTFTLRCDAGLPDEDVRELFAQYPNCVGFEMAKRYSLSLLQWSMKEGYRGSIVIIGNPEVKPSDICYVMDEYNDMYGPVEVEQVVHKFSQENGFITEITPNMVVHVNQASTLSSVDAMGLITEHAIKSTGIQSLPSLLAASGTTGEVLAGIGSTAANVVGGVFEGANTATSWAFAPMANMLFNSEENTLSQGSTTTPLGLLGIFIFRKLITRSQLAHPMRYSPLVKSGQPMLGGTPVRITDGSFITSLKTTIKEGMLGVPLLLSDTYDKINPNNWLGHSTGDFSDFFFGKER